MSLIEWSDQFALGVEWMDDTHREFVQMVQSLDSAGEDGFLAQYDAFIAHTEDHFQRENEIMQQTAFPPLHCHLSEHENVLNIMRDVRRMVADEGRFDVGRVLVREMAPWFTNHAATMDNMLARFLQMQADGQSVSPSQMPPACGAGCGHEHEAA